MKKKNIPKSTSLNFEVGCANFEGCANLEAEVFSLKMRIRVLEQIGVKNPEHNLNKIEHEAAALNTEMGHKLLAKEAQLVKLKQLMK